MRLLLILAAVAAATACATITPKVSAEEQCTGLSYQPTEYAACVEGVNAEVRKLERQENARRFERVIGGVAAAGGATAPAPSSSAPPRIGTTNCMLQNSTQSGFNRICYYNCVGSTRAETIAATDLCPLMLN